MKINFPRSASLKLNISLRKVVLFQVPANHIGWRYLKLTTKYQAASANYYKDGQKRYRLTNDPQAIYTPNGGRQQK
jgi:hypothetical protein